MTDPHADYWKELAEHHAAARAKAEARVLELSQALKDLIEDYEAPDPYPTSERHQAYAARKTLYGENITTN